jgi:hypothetical protein
VSCSDPLKVCSPRPIRGRYLVPTPMWRSCRSTPSHLREGGPAERADGNGKGQRDRRSQKKNKQNGTAGGCGDAPILRPFPNTPRAAVWAKPLRGTGEPWGIRIYIYIWVYTYIYTHEYVYARRYTCDLSHQHVFCRWTSEGIYTSLITEIA